MFHVKRTDDRWVLPAGESRTHPGRNEPDAAPGRGRPAPAPVPAPRRSHRSSPPPLQGWLWALSRSSARAPRSVPLTRLPLRSWLVDAPSQWGYLQARRSASHSFLYPASPASAEPPAGKRVRRAPVHRIQGVGHRWPGAGSSPMFHVKHLGTLRLGRPRPSSANPSRARRPRQLSDPLPFHSLSTTDQATLGISSVWSGLPRREVASQFTLRRAMPHASTRPRSPTLSPVELPPRADRPSHADDRRPALPGE